VASGRITIDVGLEASGVAKGAKDAEKALEKLEDAVGDAAKEGKQLDKIEDELKDVQRQSDKTGRDVGKNMDDGFDRAKKGADDFKQEANSTAREAAASFDGSAESIADAFQEVTANAFGGFGPAGAVAGLAAAAGIGLAVKAFEEVGEAQELSEEKVADWAKAFIESGNRIIGAAHVVAEVQAIATDPERYKVAAQNAKDWGVDETTAMRAMAGDATALEVTRRRLNERTEESNRLLAEQEQQVDSSAGAAYDLADSVNRGAEAFSVLTGEMTAGQQRAQGVSEGLKDIVNDAASAIKEVDELGNAVYTLPDGTQIMIDAETGQATTDVSRFKGDLDGIPETVTSTVKIQVDDTNWRLWKPNPKSGMVYGQAAGMTRQLIR
jgi:hypothetical protein